MLTIGYQYNLEGVDLQETGSSVSTDEGMTFLNSSQAYYLHQLHIDN